MFVISFLHTYIVSMLDFFKKNLKKIFQIEFATLDAAAYRLWKSYEDNLSLSPSPVFGSANALQGNVNGALGYWCGYGTQEYVFVPIAPRGVRKIKN